MIFKRRDMPPFLDRARAFVAPRKGWRRVVTYLGHRVRRIPDTPHRIALGFALGAFASFNPFFGIDFLYAATLAWLFRGNLLAALTGTFVGNPLTFPVIAPICLSLGYLVLGRPLGHADFNTISGAFAQAGAGLRDGFLSLLGRAEPDWGKLAYFFDTVLFPYLVGGALLGLAAGTTAYLILRPLVAAYQAARRAMLTERARRRAADLAALHREGAATEADTDAP